ncbi:MAG TPA: BamA/TamA family outer membrane protein [Sphingobium sp.]|uniref:autotransporter assembly complex protein TamA n=1 Tax=Sphingobium sp. TaxID=1912891 RepID=UPI002ED21077
MDRRSSSSIRQPDPAGAAAAMIAAALLLCAECPTAFAQTSPAGPASQSPATVAPLPSSDLDTMPDIGLDWPDLGVDDSKLLPPPPPEPVEPMAGLPDGSAPVVLPTLDPQADDRARQAERLARIDPALPLHYDVELKGIDAIADSLFKTRFGAASELEKDVKEDANIAQITRRAKADVELLDRLMRTRGYYDSRITYQLDALEGRGQQHLDVTLNVTPRDLYKLSEVTVSGLSPTDPREVALRGLFTVKPGDPADTDLILASTDKLRTGLADGGYPFAKVDEPTLHVDHDDHDATLDVIVATGGYRRYGRLTVTGDPPFNAAHVSDIARFEPGDPFDEREITDLKRALVATGLVGSAEVTPEKGASDEAVDLVVNLTKAPPRTIAGELGYGTGEGARAALSWTHRNLFPPEGALTVRAVLGTQEQTASVNFRRSNFGERDHILNTQLAYSYLSQDAYTAKTVTLSTSFEKVTNIIFQKKWAWSVGGELVASDERDLYGASLTPRRRQYFTAALPAKIYYDGTNDLLDPTRGFRLGGWVSPELSFQDGTFGYVRAQVDGSAYFPASEQITLAGRFRLGTIVGASADRIAPTRRFYAGGGGSVRGYAYQAIGPRDLNNDPVGGRSLGELSFELRYRFGSQKQFGIVPFIDAGTIDSDPWPSLQEMRVGAGLGFRYYSSFGPIRLDVGTPINPQAGDPPIGVYVSLGQAF